MDSIARHSKSDLMCCSSGEQTAAQRLRRQVSGNIGAIDVDFTVETSASVGKVTSSTLVVAGARLWTSDTLSTPCTPCDALTAVGAHLLHNPDTRASVREEHVLRAATAQRSEHAAQHSIAQHSSSTAAQQQYRGKALTL